MCPDVLLSSLSSVTIQIQISLRTGGVKELVDIDSLDRLSMACPAMPLCGLAIGEAERGLPDINRRLRELLVKLGLSQDSMVIRMTGCPNGCARPYMAELGFVCDGPNSYQVRPGCCKLSQGGVRVRVRARFQRG